MRRIAGLALLAALAGCNGVEYEYRQSPSPVYSHDELTPHQRDCFVAVSHDCNLLLECGYISTSDLALCTHRNAWTCVEHGYDSAGQLDACVDALDAQLSCDAPLIRTPACYWLYGV